MSLEARRDPGRDAQRMAQEARRDDLSATAKKALEYEAGRMEQHAERLKETTETPTLAELAQIQGVLESLERDSGIEITDDIRNSVTKSIVGARELSYAKPRSEETPSYLQPKAPETKRSSGTIAERAAEQKAENEGNQRKEYFITAMSRITGNKESATSVFDNMSAEDQEYLLGLDTAQLDLLAPVYAEAAFESGVAAMPAEEAPETPGAEQEAA